MTSSAPKPQPTAATITHIRETGLTALILSAALGLKKFLNSPKTLQAIPQPLLNALPLIVKVAGAVCALKALSLINKVISHKAANNWIKDDTWDWSKEIVVITGASSGIGEGVAQSLASRGVKVMNLDLHPPKQSPGPNIFFYETDVTSSNNLKRVADEIRAQHGNPTVLINNAGIGFTQTILDESEERIRATFNVNTIAHFLTVKEFLPAMIKENHGHVVTIASFASFVSIAQNVDYSGTKASALAFHEGLSQELKHRYDARRVRTSIIHPYWVGTPLTEAVMGKDGFPKTVLRADDVAQSIVKVVLSGEGAQVIIPDTRRVEMVRGLPTWLQERIRDSQAKVLQSVVG